MVIEYFDISKCWFIFLLLSFARVMVSEDAYSEALKGNF